MAARQDEFTTYLLEQLAPPGPVSARRMFGGTGLYHGAIMFALIARDELHFKVGDANRPAFGAAGQAPFSYATKHGTHTITSYWSCPSELLDDPDALRHWARGAIAVALAAAKPKRKPKPRKRRA